MDDKIQTAVLFVAYELFDSDVIYLVPQKILFGNCSDDVTNFCSFEDDTNYNNIDDALKNGSSTGFYYVKPLEELENKYKSDNMDDISELYLKDLYSKVYYYENFDANNFENCTIKECSIEEFNEKFSCNFEYEDEEDYDDIESTTEPLSGNLKNIKRALDRSVLFQDLAKNKILATLYNNFIISKNNSHILLDGPSGVGKTTLLQQIEESSTQPVIYTNFNSLLSNYKGDYLDGLLEGLYGKIVCNNESFQHGVIIIDDLDNPDNNVEMCVLTDEIISFIKDGSKMVYIDGKNIRFPADKITFILCGNFNKAEHEYFVPVDFFKEEQEDEFTLMPSVSDLSLVYGFDSSLLDYFTTIVTFDSLTFEQSKKIMLESEASPLELYIDQLSKQGIVTYISDEVIDLICRRVYSKNKNLTNLEKVIKRVFKDVVVESLEYVGKPAELVINEHILDKNKKGYELKLIKGSKID